jgi:hypothetical protein
MRPNPVAQIFRRTRSFPFDAIPNPARDPVIAPFSVTGHRRNQRTINVFAWPAKSATADTTQDRRGYSVINRNINGLHYPIVSDLNTKELTEFAALPAQ